MDLFRILEAAEAAELDYSISSAALAANIIAEYEQRARPRRDLGHGPDADEPEDW